eukprot:12109465-Alexandrium_andersonii.AAC.1
MSAQREDECRLLKPSQGLPKWETAPRPSEGQAMALCPCRRELEGPTCSMAPSRTVWIEAATKTTTTTESYQNPPHDLRIPRPANAALCAHPMS